MADTVNVKEIMQKRYTTKHYLPGKKIPEAVFDQLMEALRLAPTSVNAQLTRFYVARTQEAKERIAPAIMDFNVPRILNASDVVVIAVKEEADEAHLQRVLEKEKLDGRFPNDEIMKAQDEGRRHFVDLNRQGIGVYQWASRQAYIAFGILLESAALLGINATAIEGLECDKMDEILGFKKLGLRTLACVSLGYADPKDANGIRPKSRLNREELIKTID